MKGAAFALLLAAAAPAGATVRMDPLAGLWRDDFTDLAGLASNQQGAAASPSGYTINSAIQIWTQPYATTGFYDTFSTANDRLSPTVQIENPGSSAAALTLFSQRYDPGYDLEVFKNCYDRSGYKCPLDPTQTNSFQNGAYSRKAISNVPYQGQGLVGGVGWDVLVDNTGDPAIPFTEIINQTQYGTPWRDSIAGATGPLMYDARIKTLLAGQGYSVSFLVSAILTNYHWAHTTVPYVLYEFDELKTGKTHASATLYEGEFIFQNLGSQFNQMTPVTLTVDPLPAISGAVWDPEVWNLTQPAGVGGHTHCTTMGPVWVTATRGNVVSKVFDTLSDRTRWVQICWTIDANTLFSDSTKSPIPLGSPITPVRLGYGVSNTVAPVLPTTFTVTHGGEQAAGVIGLNMVANSCNPIHDGAGAPVVGRYFQWSATLYGRAAAGQLDSDLAPADPKIFWGALRPEIKSVSVWYYVCAAQGLSRRVAPSSVRSWRTVDWTADGAPPGIIHVDVLSEAGDVLLADAAPGASLAGINAWQYPVLVLRATLESAPADCDRRPILRAWQLTWDPLDDVIVLGCNGIRPLLGESCQMEVRVDQAGPVRVEVHDAAGQAVRTLLDADEPAEARMLSWDGRNGNDEIVAAGVYFVVARVRGGRRVKRLAVIR